MLNKEQVFVVAKEIADKLNAIIPSLGGDIISVDDLTGGFNVMGASVYVPIKGLFQSKNGRKFYIPQSIRVSDHSVGAARYNEHYHVLKSSDIDNVVNAIVNRIQERL